MYLVFVWKSFVPPTLYNGHLISSILFVWDVYIECGNVLFYSVNLKD